MLTLQHVKAPGTAEIVASARTSRTERGVEWVAGRILNPPAPAGTRTTAMTAEERSAVERGATMYAESCFACHGEDGRGAPTPGGGGLRAPSLAGSTRVIGHREYVIRTLLHGLTGPVDGRKYAEAMAPMGASTDRWIADVASFIRNSFGNSASAVTEADVAAARQTTAGRTAPWTVAELTRALPRPLIPDGSWRATASHNSAAAAGAFDFTRWSSEVPQQAGMWFQIELPRLVTLTEIQFESEVIPNRQGGAPTFTAPRGYRVEVSKDGHTWSQPVAEGRGTGRTTTISFPPASARFVRLTQTSDGEGAPRWTIERLRAYEPPV
jgi:mono/diheme cytochrome c family protein